MTERRHLLCAHCPHYNGMHTIDGACTLCACWSGKPEPHPDSTAGKGARMARLKRQIMDGRPAVTLTRLSGAREEEQ